MGRKRGATDGQDPDDRGGADQGERAHCAGWQDMDGAPSQVMFSFNRLRSTVDDPNASWQLLLRVVADFVVVIEGRQFYSECDFPVIEFATQAARWLRSSGPDFLYVSMESAEEPLLAFYQLPDDQFRVCSPHQEFEALGTVDRGKLRDALVSFNEDLKRSVGTELDLKIDAVL